MGSLGREWIKVSQRALSVAYLRWESRRVFRVLSERSVVEVSHRHRRMKEWRTHVVVTIRRIPTGRSWDRGRGLYLIILRHFLSRRWRWRLMSSSLFSSSDNEERHGRKCGKRHNTSHHTYKRSTKSVIRSAPSKTRTNRAYHRQ